MDSVTTLQQNNGTTSLATLKNEEELLKEQIRKKQIEQIAIKTLSEELTHVLDLGDAIDVVNKYLWESEVQSLNSKLDFEPPIIHQSIIHLFTVHCGLQSSHPLHTDFYISPHKVGPFYD